MTPAITDARLAQTATHRAESLFAADYAGGLDRIRQQLSGARALVIGGAGSIGSSVVRQLCQLEMAALHVVDQSENSLVELTRDLRNSGQRLAPADLQWLPLDFGSPVMQRFLASTKPYDFVLNFAAIKHVRSEKDVTSVLHMLDVNVLSQHRLLGWIHASNPQARYFSVSTDKAANPVNLMGASKRLMEHVMFAGAAGGSTPLRATSARFANVAFSDGSLLQGWLQRLAKGQPLAVPRSTRRFFVSLEEAGQLCVLAALCQADRQILVPRLSPEADLHDLEHVAEAFLRLQGFESARYTDAARAIADVSKEKAAGRYPLLVTPLDTSGEKPYEEFVGSNETSVEVGLPNLLAVQYRSLERPAVLSALLGTLATLIADVTRPVSKQDLVDLVGGVVEEFAHVETGKRLDDRV